MSERDRFLQSFGWNEFFASSFDEHKASGLSSGRIIGQGRGSYRIQVALEQVLEGMVAAKLRRAANSDKSVAYPAVGDWVLFSLEPGKPQVSIQHVLKRKSIVQRQRSGSQHEAQIIAANVDFMFVVTSLNEDFDLAQLKRYIALGRDSGATPVILLTKSDLCPNPDEYVKRCETEFKTVEIVLISSEILGSLEALEKFFSPGATSLLIGSSGVGKSTLTNFLLGFDSQKTQGLSAESRGRHTTTARNLLITRWGGLVIDTPGMQEIWSLDSAETAIKDFSDIEQLALKCKFTNCRHGNEPGCAIATGLKNGTLSPARWDGYLKAAEARRGKKNRT